MWIVNCCCWIWNPVLNCTVLFLTTYFMGESKAGVDGGWLAGICLVQIGWNLGYQQSVGTDFLTNAMVGMLNKKEAQAAATKVGTRCVMNAIEQGIMFMPNLWMYSAFVDCHTGLTMGATYVCLLSFYPVMYTWHGQFNAMCELSTQPRYGIQVYFMVCSAFKAFGKDFFFEILPQAWYFKWPIMYGLIAYSHIWTQVTIGWFYPFGMLAAGQNIAANQKRIDLGEWDEALNP